MAKSKGPNHTEILISDLVREWVTNFETKKDTPNQEYLEFYLGKLEADLMIYRVKSENQMISPKERARYRDYEHTIKGCLSGIKFAISFWLHREQNLSEDLEANEKEKTDILIN